MDADLAAVGALFMPTKILSVCLGGNTACDKIMFCACLLADLPVPTALLALLVRSALEVAACLQ
jgi:hypothetical protein